jgi:hypothetical protein
LVLIKWFSSFGHKIIKNLKRKQNLAINQRRIHISFEIQNCVKKCKKNNRFAFSIHTGMSTEFIEQISV